MGDANLTFPCAECHAEQVLLATTKARKQKIRAIAMSGIPSVDLSFEVECPAFVCDVSGNKNEDKDDPKQESMDGQK